MKSPILWVQARSVRAIWSARAMPSSSHRFLVYTRINGWDLSPGYEAGTFRDFTRPALELCVDCHTGQPSFVADRPNHFQQPPFRFLSIGCERCHGPGATHVMERKEGSPPETPIDYSIVNPATMPRKSVTISARNATSWATPGPAAGKNSPRLPARNTAGQSGGHFFRSGKGQGRPIHRSG